MSHRGHQGVIGEPGQFPACRDGRCRGRGRVRRILHAQACKLQDFATLFGRVAGCMPGLGRHDRPATVMVARRPATLLFSSFSYHLFSLLLLCSVSLDFLFLYFPSFSRKANAEMMHQCRCLSCTMHVTSTLTMRGVWSGLLCWVECSIYIVASKSSSRSCCSLRI